MADWNFYTRTTAGLLMGGHAALMGGQKRGKGTAKRKALKDGNSQVVRASRTLHKEPLIDIPLTSNAIPSEEINARQRDIAYICGIKFCYEFFNSGTDTSDMWQVNFALVVPRCRKDVAEADFFRSSDLQRSVDFSTALSSLEFNCLPINADEYNVIWRKRFRVMPQNHNSQGKWLKKVEGYIPIKRQYRFDDGQSVPDCPQPTIVYWIDQMPTDGGFPVVSSALLLTHRLVTYFREPK